MKNKAKIPLLVSHIVGNIGLLILAITIFVAFVVIGALAGGITGAAGGDAGEASGEIILTGYLIMLAIGTIIICDIVSMVLGFRKNRNKTCGIIATVFESVAGAGAIGLSIYFLSNGINSIISSASENNSYLDSLGLVISTIIILAILLTLYILTIIFIYSLHYKKQVEPNN